MLFTTLIHDSLVAPYTWTRVKASIGKDSASYLQRHDHLTRKWSRPAPTSLLSTLSR